MNHHGEILGDKKVSELKVQLEGFTKIGNFVTDAQKMSDV